MIERLCKHIIKDSYGTIYGSNPPTANEMLDKINEIIDYINKLEEVKKDDMPLL